MKALLYLLPALLAGFPALAQDAPAESPGAAATRPVNINAGDKEFIKGYITRYKSGLVNLPKDKAILLNYVDLSLRRNNLPVELKNLVIVESYLEHKTTSAAGAAGPWQLMPGTAKASGLVVNDVLDERFDLIKSTAVAMKLLKFLHKRYGNWQLAVAAYNCGSGRVDNAIQQANSKMYWDVEQFLPEETRNHVKKFLASSVVTEGRIPESAMQTEIKEYKDTLSERGLMTEKLNASYRLDVISEQINMPENELRRLNPDYETKMAENADYLLVLPKQKMQDFLYHKSDILKASIEKNVAEDAGADATGG